MPFKKVVNLIWVGLVYTLLLILLRFIYPMLGLRTDFSQRMNMKAQFSNDLFIYETIRASRVNSS